MTPKLGSSLQPNTESPRGKGEKKKTGQANSSCGPFAVWFQMGKHVTVAYLERWHCHNSPLRLLLFVALQSCNRFGQWDFFFWARISTAEHKNEYFLCRTCGNESLPLLHSFMCSSQLLQFCYASAASISAIGKGWRDIKGEIAKAKAIPHGINVLRL